MKVVQAMRSRCGFPGTGDKPPRYDSPRARNSTYRNAFSTSRANALMTSERLPLSTAYG